MNTKKFNATLIGMCILIVSIVLILKARDRTSTTSKGTVLLQSGQAGRENIKETFANLDQAALKRHGYGMMPISHVYPSQDVEEMGLLSEIGIRRSFDQIADMPLPENMKPLFGEYTVSKYHSRSKDDFNAQVSLYFKYAPPEVNEFIDRLETKWKQRIGDVPIYMKRTHGGWTLKEGFQFSEGSVSAIVREKKSVGLKHSYMVSGDPATGLIWIKNFRGDNE